MESYQDQACTTLASTVQEQLNTCIDTTAGGPQPSSMMYVVCNATTVEVHGYGTNNCGGGVQFTMTGAPNTCLQSQQKVICSSSPSPPSPPSPPGPAPAPSPVPAPPYVKVESYLSQSCSGSVFLTQSIAINHCQDTSSGGAATSMKYTSCNGTLVTSTGYNSNNCTGSVLYTGAWTPGTCNQQQVMTCVLTSPSPSPGRVTSSAFLVTVSMTWFVATILLALLF